MGISTDMFIKTYKANMKAKDKTFDDFIDKHIVENYIDFIKKNVYCDTIIKSTCYVKNGDREIIKMNSPLRYVFFTMRLIDLYTDIDIDISNVISEYDKLNEIGAIDVITNKIPQSEYIEFSTILDMKLDDIKDNEYSLTAMAYNFKESFSISEDIINSVIDEIKDKIDINK